MFYKKVLLVVLCSVMYEVNASDHSSEKEYHTREQMDSALRAIAVGVVGGFSSNYLIDEGRIANLAGVILSGSANVLVGEFAFKDRNYTAQVAGWLFGYVLGSVVGHKVKRG